MPQRSADAQLRMKPYNGERRGSPADQHAGLPGAVPPGGSPR